MFNLIKKLLIGEIPSGEPYLVIDEGNWLTIIDKETKTVTKRVHDFNDVWGTKWRWYHNCYFKTSTGQIKKNVSYDNWSPEHPRYFSILKEPIPDYEI